MTKSRKFEKFRSTQQEVLLKFLIGERMHRSNKFSDCKVIVLKSINEANVQDCTVVSFGLMIEGVEGLIFSSDTMHTLPNCRR